MLSVTDLRAGYGRQEVLHGVDVACGEGETLVILGLNGAGKSTLLGCVAGVVPVTNGRLGLDGADITHLDAADRVARGVALVPEGRRVFPRLTVAQNLRVGAWVRRRDPEAVAAAEELVYSTFPRLRERADQPAGTLSGGEQQMLAIGRALMARPRLLLVDEASLGLSPATAASVLAAVRAVNERGVTVVLVDQSVDALAHADRAVVLEQGTVSYRGPATDLAGELRERLLGAA